MNDVLNWIQKNVQLSFGSNDKPEEKMKDFKLGVGTNFIVKETNEFGKVNSIYLESKDSKFNISITFKIGNNEPESISLDKFIERFTF